MAAVPEGPLRLVLSVDSAVAAFRDTISQIVRFEIEQQVAQGTLAVELDLQDGGEPLAEAEEAQSREADAVADAFASQIPFLLLFDVRGTTDAVTMELTWYDVDAAARTTATRSGRIGLDLDGVVVAAVREVVETPTEQRQVADDLLAARRRASRALLVAGRSGLMSVVGGLGGDLLPTVALATFLGLELDLRDARLTIGAEGSYFPIATTGGSGGPEFIVPVIAEVQYAFGEPLELHARAGLGVALLAAGELEGGPIPLPGVAVALGGSLPIAGTARVVLDFGVHIFYSGNARLFVGVRPSLGLAVSMRAGG